MVQEIDAIVVGVRHGAISCVLLLSLSLPD